MSGLYSFGEVVFGPSENLRLPSRRDPRRTFLVERSEGHWRPSPRFTRWLPPGFSFPLLRLVDENGFQRIIPRCNADELLDLGMVGGIAVLQAVYDLNEHQSFSYRMMLLVNQHVRGREHLGTRGVQEHLMRQFHASRDLHVRRPGRVVDAERDILPEDIGLATDGTGHRWSVQELTNRGRRSSQRMGYANATNKVAICHGFFEAAQLNPLALEDGAVPSLVHQLLYDSGEGPSVPSDIQEIVEDRLLAAIRRHRDDSDKQFQSWFSGPKNSLPKQIAEQPSSRGGRLEIRIVRRALLALGWRSYQHLSGAVHALMRVIGNAAALNDEERRLFEQMHERQPYFGNMPAVLLAERLSFLKPAIASIWDEPSDRRHIQVLHRMMHYYAEMVERRRQADRRTKQRAGGNPRDAHVPCETAFNPNLHSPRASEASVFSELAEQLRQQRGIRCPRGCETFDDRVEDGTDDPIRITMSCRCGATRQSVTVTLEELRVLARNLGPG